jgi:hypothetical protein
MTGEARENFLRVAFLICFTTSFDFAIFQALSKISNPIMKLKSSPNIMPDTGPLLLTEKIRLLLYHLPSVIIGRHRDRFPYAPKPGDAVFAKKNGERRTTVLYKKLSLRR